jgi:hypothetical protein
MEDPEKQRFSFSSDKSKEWEVVHSQNFEVKVKRGLFIEVFYSPYFDEVV